MTVRLFYFIISFMFMFFTSNFDIQEKYSAFKDLPQNIVLLGKIESSREYSFIKINKIELADRTVLKNPMPAFLEMTEIVTEDPCISTVIYPQKDILTFYTILERYYSRILLI